MSAPTPDPDFPPAFAGQTESMALLVDVSPRIRPQLEDELRGRGFSVVDVVPEPGAPVHLVIVESDRGPAMMAAVRDARLKLPGVVVVGITGWWNDVEAEVRRAADAVLHAPLSARECRSVLLGLSAGTTAAPEAAAS